MKFLDIIALVLKFALELWRSKNKKTPEQVKLEAVAKITKEMNDDVKTFNEALAEGDASALSAHFEQLRLRALKATGGSGS